MRGYVTTDWGEVHYRRGGTEQRAVLLLHESPLSSEVYLPAMGPLARGCQVLAFDTPGYGASDPPPDDGREIADYAAILLQALDQLHSGPITAVGVHTGASLALQLALQAGPDRIEGLVFSGLPLLDAEQRAEYLRTWAPPMTAAEDGSHLTWAWERYARIWEGPARIRQVGVRELIRNLDRYHWAYNAAFRYDVEPDLSHVEVPVLFLTAERDLLIDADRRAVEHLADARLEVVPRVAGQLPLRVPERFAAGVHGFVAAR